MSGIGETVSAPDESTVQKLLLRSGGGVVNTERCLDESELFAEFRCKARGVVSLDRKPTATLRSQGAKGRDNHVPARSYGVA
jgi:hypothetical protein